MIDAIIDFIGVLGLFFLAIGLWLISPMWMFTVMGVLLVCFALFASRGSITIRRPEKKKG